MSDDRSNTSVDLASHLTVAWLGNPNTRATADEATAFLRNIHAALANLSGASSVGADSGVNFGDNASEETYEPAVTVRKSLASREHIISLIDGKPYRTLKRHLSGHGLTPAQYRERYGLKADYPMVAPAYAETRRALAKKIGLGSTTTRRGKATPSVKADGRAPNRRGRPPKRAAK